MWRRLFATALALVFPSAMSQTNQPPKGDPAGAMRELRIKMLTTPASDFDIKPSGAFPRVYGVLMDWPIDDMTVTIVSLSDGSASLYSTSTFGVIGGIGHESVRRTAIEFVKAAEAHYSSAAPTKEYPYPKRGRVIFYLVCFDGVRVIETDLDSVVSGKGRDSDLWTRGQAVMTELRLTAQKNP